MLFSLFIDFFKVLVYNEVIGKSHQGGAENDLL